MIIVELVDYLAETGPQPINDIERRRSSTEIEHRRPSAEIEYRRPPAEVERRGPSTVFAALQKLEIVFSWFSFAVKQVLKLHRKFTEISS